MNPLLIILGVALVAVFYLILPMIVIGITKYRKRKFVVRCPNTMENAAVEVSTGSAAISEFQRAPRLKLSNCTLWPGHEDCGQECMKPDERHTLAS